MNWFIGSMAAIRLSYLNPRPSSGTDGAGPNFFVCLVAHPHGGSHHGIDRRHRPDQQTADQAEGRCVGDMIDETSLNPARQAPR